MTSRSRKRVHVPDGILLTQGSHSSESLRRRDLEAKRAAVRRNRLGIVTGVFLVSFFALVIRLVDLTLLSFDHVDEPQRIAYAPLAENDFRRDIVDRRGEIIATNLRTFELYVNPAAVHSLDETLGAIESVFQETDPDRLKARIGKARGLVRVAGGLTPRQHSALRAKGLPSLEFHSEVRRAYPKGSLVSHIVGFIGEERRGLEGLELSLDEDLRDLTAKGPVVLSLDLGVQHIVRHEIKKAMDDFDAIGGAGIVLDVNTGEVIAMVSLPDYDPNDLSTFGDANRINKATNRNFEMGSTFKIFNTAMAIDSGSMNVDDLFDARKPYKIATHKIHDDHPQARWLSVAEILRHSSNIGSAKMAHRMGVDVQLDYFERFGFFSRLGLEVPDRVHPDLPEKWGLTETATISYGHGISVSPMHVVAATASAVNGGLYIKPTILRRKSTVHARRVISSETSYLMRGLLRDVVAAGTGKKAKARGYSVGGKTGTAEKPLDGGYNKKRLVTSFAAVFPTFAPEYVVLIVLDEPKGTPATHYFAGAGWNAAPVAGRVVERIAPVLRVPPRLENSPAVQTLRASYME